MASLVMAIDQGTTGTTVLLLDDNGKLVTRAYGEIRQYYPRPGWVEHDGEEIFASVRALAARALRQARARASDIAAIGLANQRETLLVWDKTSGQPVAPAIVWQCRRSAEICREMRAHQDVIRRRTGLLLDPYFSASKLKWLLDSSPLLRRRAARGKLCFGTIESWLIYRLSGGQVHVSDYTNASRTLLLNLRTRQWDPVMLDLFGVPPEMLPKVVPSRGPLAETAAGMIGVRALPIASAIGDQQAALFGLDAVSAGDTKVTYGTGAFMLMHTGTRLVTSRNRLLTTLALGPQGEPAAALEGSIFVAGAVVQWLRDGLKLIKRAADTERLIASASPNADQTYFVPAFVGLGAPWWDSEARGAIVGLTRGTTAADIVRAGVESIAYQVADVLSAMERDCGKRIVRLQADGGAAANDYLLQFQADLLGRPVQRASLLEATAAGAAKLAGMACGLWPAPPPLTEAKVRRFLPRISSRERTRRVRGWHAAVGRILTQPPPTK
ncbi:MAG TPA: glycerol kinase GlpK [Candidatus Binataceae bacterium]|nr:glycerol kinase GlpK [Candidatus Binataceae bacterium]